MGEIILLAMINNDNFTYDEEKDTLYVYDESVSTCNEEDLKDLEYISLVRDDNDRVIGIQFKGFKKTIAETLSNKYSEGDDSNVTF